MPIEESARELEARLILALCAVRDGWKAVIGHQTGFFKHAHRLPNGVYFAKGTNEIQRREMAALKRRGFGITAIEEENVPLADPLLIKHIMAKGAADLIDLYFAHGEFDAEVVAEANPTIRNKLEIVGVGRFDLLKRNFLKQRQAKTVELMERYGNFILINTNFGYANTFLGSPRDFYDRMLVGFGLIDVNNEIERALWDRALEFETRTMERVMALVRTLAAEVPVVIRPHTSENLSTWQALEDEMDWGGRLQVVREGPVIDWLLASRLVVQNSCTTGLEAKAMGAPVISYTPFDNGMLSSFVANQVMRRVNTDAEVLDLARRAVKGDPLEDVLTGTGPEPIGRYIRQSDGELVSERQWQSIKRKFDGVTKPASAAVFPKEKLKLENLHPQMKRKFSVTPEQFRDALVMVTRAVRSAFDVNVRVAGAGLFELSRPVQSPTADPALHLSA
ncbi:surface carbohydrate biosynthesis protein [Nisaea sp.]|uniref:surface carbohydrate biosynthesis protein n=1 Tax=Nisaea sp. TaxID=2024842 RepID=UPI003B5190C8